MDLGRYKKVGLSAVIENVWVPVWALADCPPRFLDLIKLARQRKVGPLAALTT